MQSPNGSDVCTMAGHSRSISCLATYVALLLHDSCAVHTMYIVMPWDTLRQAWQLSSGFWISPSRHRQAARLLVAALVGMAIASTLLQVHMSFVSKEMMTAMSERDRDRFWSSVVSFLGVLVVAIPLFTAYRYLQDTLTIRWRLWLTNLLLRRYFAHRAFYRLRLSRKEIDNPDQRIADDIANLVGFAGVLYHISPTMSATLIVYAMSGTFVALSVFARHLASLGSHRFKLEADFRYSLVHVSENAESIAFYAGERAEHGVCVGRLDKNAFRYVILVLPCIVIAPIYFTGGVDFGVVSQANLAFQTLMRSMGTIVEELNNISSYAARTTRLCAMWTAINEDDEHAGECIAVEEQTHAGDRLIQLADVTVCVPRAGTCLIDSLNFTIRKRQSLLVVGDSGVGKSSLLRVLAGLWRRGSGTIRLGITMREAMFLPQRPYLILGTLRQQVLYPNAKSAEFSDQDIRSAMAVVRIESLIDRFDGLDSKRDWQQVLSLGEQQRLAMARLILQRPTFALLDESSSALDVAAQDRFYRWLVAQRDIAFISVGHRPSLVAFHERVLELYGPTEACPRPTWRIFSRQEYMSSMPK
ncbi:unnamed protein product (mitochondrion) [Plasmodiophora brassicae]|uniref:ABC transporter domain-containing protein n=1 Tax=Plasmodiophora brassicae TaxID=37360 RepID=A0A3P3YFH7_PLABS|nr:unnamed protein product [Plasmodiophora brassicae]